MNSFMLCILNNCLGALTQIYLLFIIHKFGECIFHFDKLLSETLIIEFNFINKNLISL